LRLEYQIVGNADQLKQVFRSVETEARSAQRRQTTVEREGARARVAVEKSAAKATVAAAKAAERQKLAAAKAEQKEVDRIGKYWEHQKQRHHMAELRRIDQRKNAAIQAEKATAREAERAATRGARANERAARASARSRERTASRITHGAGRVMGAIGGAATAAAAIGTGLAANAVYKRVGVDTALRNVANQGFSPTDGRTREQLYGQAKDVTDRLANSTGADPEALVGAIGGIMAKTGNFDTAIGALEELNSLALATGSSIEELGATYGGAVSSLKRGGATTEDAIKQALELSRVFAGQAKFGEIETADLASQGGKLIGSAAMYGGDRTKNLADMGALAQMAAQGGSTSAEDAATAVKNFGSDAIAKADKLGVNVWSDSSKTKMRGADEIMADTMKASGGNLEKLLEVFGAQSRAVIVPNLDKFNEAGGGEAGRKAVLQNFADFRGQVLSKDEVGASSAFAASSPAAKFAAEMNKLNQKLGDELLPKLPPLIEQIGRLTPHITALATAAADAAEWLAENPYTGAAAIIAGYVGKEIIAAKIGDALRSAISGGGLPGVGGSGVPGAAGPLAGAGKKGFSWGTVGKYAGVAGLAIHGAEQLNNIAQSDNKSKTAVTQGMEHLGMVLPGAGMGSNLLNAASGAVGMFSPDAAKSMQESTRGVADAIATAIASKLDGILGTNQKAPSTTATVKLDPESLNKLMSGFSSGGVDPNRYSPMAPR
jgi:hypothetical protein